MFFSGQAARTSPGVFARPELPTPGKINLTFFSKKMVTVCVHSADVINCTPGSCCTLLLWTVELGTAPLQPPHGAQVWFWGSCPNVVLAASQSWNSSYLFTLVHSWGVHRAALPLPTLPSLLVCTQLPASCELGPCRKSKHLSVISITPSIWLITSVVLGIK